ncbi:MAG: cysteine-rich VLP domain-containing protein [Oscillospiraceae bacterium]|nr:cysteine-rich VLP domain-containing protein [Oscillospiraceae bacterium]
MSDLKFRRADAGQRRSINALIKKMCCNYDNGECLILGCPCPQMITLSLLCRWFCGAVLPNNKKLYAELAISENSRRCAVCGNKFIGGSNRAKYCGRCRKAVTLRQAAERKRKQREMSRIRSE